jgi:chromosome segregation ATPase
MMLDAETKPDTLSARAAAREQLATAINAVDEARARLAEAKRAVDLADDRCIDLRNKIDAQKERLVFMKANAGAADSVVAALARGELLEMERSPVERAQEEIDALEHELDAVRQARQTAQDEIEKRKSAVGLAEMRTRRMATAVLRVSGAAEQLLAGLIDLERQVVERRLGLRFLLAQGAIPESEKAAVERLLDASALPTSAARGDFFDWDRHPTTIAWAVALKDLQRDPDARLPG